MLEIIGRVLCRHIIVFSSILLCSWLHAQSWTPPVNLGITGVDDINPQACRACAPSLVLVWQAYINGNWEIFSRSINGSYYSDTIRVNNNSGSDQYPSAAFDGYRNCFWCAWQSNRTGNWDIYTAQRLGTWQTPYQLTNDAAIDIRPSITFVSSTQSIPRVLLEEHFENAGVPAGWSVIDGNNDNVKWNVGTTIDIGSFTPPNYGMRYAYYSDNDAGSAVVNYNEELLSPVICVGSSYSGLRLNFDYGFRVFQAGEKYRVKLRKKTGTWSPWTTIAEYTASIRGGASINLSAHLPADSVQLEWFFSDSTALNHWGYACACDNVYLVGYYNASNTVWAAWQRTSGNNNNIFFSCFNGTSWSSPLPLTNDTFPDRNTMPKINCRYYAAYPFVVWQRNQDIYYSEYLSGVWQSPQAVTSDTYSDSLPEIAVGDWGSWGTRIYWQSNRDGNWEIYCTGADTFNVSHRVTFNDSADMAPSPIFFSIPILQYEPWVAFSTNRNGNYDIYMDNWAGFTPIDTNHATDMSPVISVDNNDDIWVWVFFQTDRNGDWDINGSYHYIHAGISENGETAKRYGYSLDVSPNPCNQVTTIKYVACGAADSRNLLQQIKIGIYDAVGKPVRFFSVGLSDLYNGIIWDGCDDRGGRVPAGVYLLCLVIDEQSITKKIIFLR